MIGLLFFLVAIFLYTLIFNESTGWILFFFLFFLTVIDVLSLIPSLKNIHCVLAKQSTYEIHQTAQINFQLFRYHPNLLRIPLLVVSFGNESTAEKLYITLYSGQPKEIVFNWHPTKRGIFDKLPFVLTGFDILGVLSKQRNGHLKGPFIVLPQLQLDVAQQLYEQLLLFQPEHASQFGHRTFTVRNFREYRMGDSLNSIDWKQSGKRNKWIIREYEQEAETVLHFLFYGLPHKKFEELVSIYYSFIQFTESKLSFQQTILAEYSQSQPTNQLFAEIQPLATETDLPFFSNKKLVLFAPTQTKKLTQQIDFLKKNNDVVLITLESTGGLYIAWEDQVVFIDQGGSMHEK
ncbi:DUF58 domain-containing protein [Candidatus Enterococcus mansonii]|nr:DUF58 domain-containing protein [Enterococcus sp. 4G2_DIV0659]